VVSLEIETRPVDADDLTDLAFLFAGDRNTRHCWCTAFCTTSGQFAAGWFGGGNRRRFSKLAAAGAHPMGVLALAGNAPVGWCACGPRSRFTAAIKGRSQLLQWRQREEDDQVWLIACLYVDAQHRGRGVSHALITAAIALASRQGALAIEGWPAVPSASGVTELFVGREDLFREQGFTCVDRPSSQRSIMRLELSSRNR
jgi:GNAT superfamily N-acetyltransferase